MELPEALEIVDGIIEELDAEMGCEESDSDIDMDGGSEEELLSRIKSMLWMNAGLQGFQGAYIIEKIFDSINISFWNPGHRSRDYPIIERA